MASLEQDPHSKRYRLRFRFAGRECKRSLGTTAKREAIAAQVQFEDGSRSISIQVKTNKSGKSQWIVGKKAESYYAENFFYVFVSLHEIGERPDFYVAGSAVVARYISTSHKSWPTSTNSNNRSCKKRLRCS